jgi:Tol biopolymer transport system component
MDIDGKNSKEIYRDYDKDLLPGLAISRDGEWLAFQRGNRDVPGTDAPYDVTILDLLRLDNGRLLELEKKQPLILYNLPYSWSPVDSKIAYPDVHGNLVVYDTKTGTRKIILIFDSLAINDHVRWAPDGTKLAVAKAEISIGIVNLANPVPTEIYRSTSPILDMCWLAEEFLLLSRVDEGLLVINIATGEAYVVSHLETLSIILSPDRKSIAAVQKDTAGDEKMQIFNLSADGFHAQQLTNTGANADPFWSPTGKNILFTSYRDGHPEIYIMDADGQNQRRLTYTDGGGSHSPVWLVHSD